MIGEKEKMVEPGDEEKGYEDVLVGLTRTTGMTVTRAAGQAGRARQDRAAAAPPPPRRTITTTTTT